MATYSNQPSLDQLKRAVEVSEQIKRLEAELASILSGTSINTGKVKTTGARRGRPAGKKNADAAIEPAAPKAKKTAKKKRMMSEEGRQKIAEAQKKRWAAKKGGK